MNILLGLVCSLLAILSMVPTSEGHAGRGHRHLRFDKMNLLVESGQRQNLIDILERRLGGNVATSTPEDPPFDLTVVRVSGYEVREAVDSIAMTLPFVSACVEDTKQSVLDNCHQYEFQYPYSTGSMWGLDRINSINIPTAPWWWYRAGPNDYGQGVNAYILDTGLNVGHSEFEGRASCGWDGYGSNCNDVQGHGTHVAGTVGGKTYGVARHVSLIGVKVLGDDGSGYTSTIVNGIAWVVQHCVANKKADRKCVINMSLGGSGVSTIEQYYLSAAEYYGVKVCVAAGNSNQDACGFSPAYLSEANTHSSWGPNSAFNTPQMNIITVGATDINDVRASFSNYGSCVTISAPGVSISSVGGSWSGTSMATPHVTGAVARYISSYTFNNGYIRPEELREWVLLNAHTIATSGLPLLQTPCFS